MSKPETVISPSRTYVAICNKGNFDGHYFRKFVLPEKDPYDSGPDYRPSLENNAGIASWFFLNRLDFVACIDGCVTWEDFQNLVDQDQLIAEREARMQEITGDAKV